MRPAVPVYCRCTPTLAVPFFRSPGFVHHQDGVLVVEVLNDETVAVFVCRLAMPITIKAGSSPHAETWKTG